MITCGNCTSSLGKAMGTQIKHNTVDAVRECYDQKYAWDAYMEAEAQAEMSPTAFCDVYKVHAPHVYTAINGESYSCVGMSAEAMAELEAYEASVGTCEHGMRADLCEGPMHYQTYEDERRAAGF